MWGYARGQVPEDEALALQAIEAVAWRLVQALRACGSPEELPYLRVASRQAQKRWYVAPTQPQVAPPASANFRCDRSGIQWFR